MYTDPSGDIAFVPILLGMAYGSLIGAGTSAAIYSTNVLLTGQKWNWNSFGMSLACGAIGGALSGGFGALGGQLGTFGQSLSYNLLSNITSNSATTFAFGSDVSTGDFIGMIAGGFIGNKIGNFNGVKGGVLKNIGAEFAFNMSKGTITGGIGGAIGAIIDGDDIGDGFIQGAKFGAIGGATMAGLNIAIMGASYIPDNVYENFENDQPVYRRGTFLTKTIGGEGSGLTIGRNLIIHKLDENVQYYENNKEINVTLRNKLTEAHETRHFIQQRRMGYSNFYGKIIGEYIKYGFYNSYNNHNSLEWDAERYSFDKIGGSYFK